MLGCIRVRHNSMVALHVFLKGIMLNQVQKKQPENVAYLICNCEMKQGSHINALQRIFVLMFFFRVIKAENCSKLSKKWQTISKHISVRTECIFHDILTAFCNIISGIINLSTAIFKDKFFFQKHL